MKQQLFLLLITLLTIATGYIASPSYVNAVCTPGVGGIDLGDCLMLSNGQTVSSKYSSAGFVVNLLVRNLFIAAGLILFFVMLFAAFRFISGGKKGADDARSMFVSAIVGFLLMFSAYWIIQIIKVLTGADIPI